MAGKEDGVEAGSAGCTASVDVDVRKLVTDDVIDLEAFFGETLRYLHLSTSQELHFSLDGLKVFDVLAQLVNFGLDCCHGLVFFLGRRDPSLEFWRGWVSGHDGHGHVLEFFFGRLAFERLVEGPVPLVVLGEALCLLVALLVLDFHELAALAHAITQTFQYRADDLLQAGLAADQPLVGLAGSL